MKKIIFFIAFILCFNCVSQEPIDYTPLKGRNFREDMHKFVIAINDHAESRRPGFIVIPQNGHDLLLDNGTSSLRDDYISAIDGVGQEELFYGLGGMNKPTPIETQNWFLKLLNNAKENDKAVLVIDYATDKKLIDKSYFQNHLKGFISYGATERNLTNIPKYPPKPYKANSDDINTLNEGKNFLYLINKENFKTKSSFLYALRKTDYDIIVLDLFFMEKPFTPEDIKSLRVKAGGGRRLIICYMSIGEAEDYRFYWKFAWKRNKPSWLDLENPNWPGNYKVRYWDPLWQDLIIFNEDSYLNKIIDAGFDGVYLDIIDAFWYFEEVLGNH